jgi:hypothetical protein
MPQYRIEDGSHTRSPGASTNTWKEWCEKVTSEKYTKFKPLLLSTKEITAEKNSELK